MSKWKGKFCPKILEKMKPIKQESRYREASHFGNSIYKVDYKSGSWAVDLEIKEWLQAMAYRWNTMCACSNLYMITKTLKTTWTYMTTKWN